MGWRVPLLAGLALALSCAPGFAQNSVCPFPGEKPMQVVHLYFGRAIKGRAPVSEQEWSRFAAEVLTPNFPDGFTAYDASGQWLNPELHRVIRERSKVVMIAAEDSPDLERRLATVSDAYRRRFHQDSVGMTSETACAAF